MLIARLRHDELSWPDSEMIWTKTSGYRLKHHKSSNFYNDYKNRVVLYVLHALFIPTSKKTYTDISRKKCLHKFSIKDSQNSFMLIVNIAVELEETLKIRKHGKNPIQPFMLIVGTISEPS